ncbi:MAG: GntR family transcriptional regulator, partial [Desulforhopalus sp.]
MITILSALFARQSGRKYLRVCNTIERAISAGNLQPGDQLPPQRDLADALGVTLGTVTRGYQEARRRGLLVGETGRGTFVRPHDAYTLHGRHNNPATAAKSIPFDLNFPVHEGQPNLGEQLASLAAENRLDQLLSYQKAAGLPEHRDAALPWLSSLGITTTVASVFITAGGQHSIHTVLLAQGVDKGPVGVESFTYPGAIHCAGVLGRKLISIPMDSQGMNPDELETACRHHNLSAIYLMPAIQNPTAV